MAGTTRLVYRIIDGSTVCIRLILLTQNIHSLQRFHRDEFRSLYLLLKLQEKVCSFVRRTDCCFCKLFIILICRSLHSCQNPQLAKAILTTIIQPLKKSPCRDSLLMAGTTRLELATSCVTGMRSNQTELRSRT